MRSLVITAGSGTIDATRFVSGKFSQLVEEFSQLAWLWLDLLTEHIRFKLKEFILEPTS